MVKLNRAMEGKPFQMLAISIDEGGKAAVENYFKTSGNSLPAYLDSDGSISKMYGITGVPETFIIDKHGVIRYKEVGMVTPQNLKETILPLVKKLEQEP